MSGLGYNIYGPVSARPRYKPMFLKRASPRNLLAPLRNGHDLLRKHKTIALNLYYKSITNSGTHWMQTWTHQNN